jgi:hypothetical protein
MRVRKLPMEGKLNGVYLKFQNLGVRLYFHQSTIEKIRSFKNKWEFCKTNKTTLRGVSFLC